MSSLHDTATSLIHGLWRSIPDDYKSRYRMTIWTQFENEIRSASYTSNLGKFVNAFCGKFKAEIPDDAVQTIEKVVNSGQDTEILKLLREETTHIVLRVRLIRQEQNEKYKESLQ